MKGNGTLKTRQLGVLKCGWNRLIVRRFLLRALSVLVITSIPVSATADEVSYEVVRDAVIDYFIGPPSFNETASLDDIEDRLYETVEVAQCKDMASIKNLARNTFAKANFGEEDIDKGRPFPEYGLSLTRDVAGKLPWHDIVVLFIVPQKTGIHCRFHIVTLGKRVLIGGNKIVKGKDHDLFFNDIKALVTKFANALKQ